MPKEAKKKNDVKKKEVKKKEVVENKPFPFKIGADPEFNFAITTQRIHANQLLPALMNKKYSKTGMGWKVGKHGNMGVDGNSATAEIRPAPEHTPEALTENFKAIFKAIADESTQFDMSVLSKYAPVGGHIHLELPDGVPAGMQSIHKKVSSFGLMIILGEETVNNKTRMQSGYGKLQDHREEIKGGSYTYEIRWPSAEWLVTEKICRSTLAYMACVFHEITRNPKNVTGLKDLVYTNDQTGKALQELAMGKYGLMTKSITDIIKKSVRTFEFYPQYKEEIEYILNPAKVMKDKKEANFNILEGWGLAKTTTPTKRTLLSEKSVKEATDKTEIDLDALGGMIPIYINPDTNVSAFAEEIKRRSLVLNWRLKNTYFYYGLKKGVKELVARDLNGKWLQGQSQCKTMHDRTQLTTTTSGMERKFKNYVYPSTTEEKANHILIGIPYGMRTDLKPKKFIELVHKIEKGIPDKETLTKEDFDEKKLEDDKKEVRKMVMEGSVTTEEKKKIGEVYKAYNMVKGLNPEAMVTGISSSTTEAHQIATREEQVTIETLNSFKHD